MKRADWDVIRSRVITAQSHRCARDDCPHIGSLDVIKIGPDWIGFCRRDRLRIDAVERCGKAARTRAGRKRQERLFS